MSYIVIVVSCRCLRSPRGKKDMAKLNMNMQDPVLVATSAAGETRWGFHQFPALSRLPDGRIILMHADAQDASETHGEPAPSYCSRDGGATWAPLTSSLQPVRPHYSVSKVFDGEYLIVPSTRYLNVKEAGIQLPEPSAEADTYGKRYTYRINALPSDVREYFAHLPAKRWRPADATWSDDQVDYDMAGLLAWRAGNSDVLPRTFFERELLRYRGELLYADYRARYERVDGLIPAKGASTLMVSTDNGKSFRRRATIADDPADKDLMGEPHLSPTADGRLVCVIRRTDQVRKPMCIAWSEDSGYTWSPVRSLFDFGVWPCVLLLGNGTLVLSYGRPGVHLAFDPDGTGDRWSEHRSLIDGDRQADQKHSCGYTSLMPLDDDTFLIAYSDFLYTNAKGEPCKAILTRRIQATPGAGSPNQH